MEGLGSRVEGLGFRVLDSGMLFLWCRHWHSYAHRRFNRSEALNLTVRFASPHASQVT